MKYDQIIWDFNGTILDDVDVGIRAVNFLLKERGLKTIDSLEYYHSIFGFPIKEYYSKAGFDFSKESYESVAPEWVEKYLEYEPEAGLCKDVITAMDTFKSLNIDQYLVSATEINMLISQLKRRNIYDYFKGIYGLDNIHAGSKAHIASEVVAGLSGKTVMIGDTVHDAECAIAAGADVILVAAGHQSFERLKSTGSVTVHSLKEAIDIIIGD